MPVRAKIVAMRGIEDLESLVQSWEIHLRSERKSKQTLKQYLTGVNRWLRWCEETGTPPRLDRRTVEAFTAHLLDNGAGATTAALRRFSAWLVDEGELERDELVGIKPPKKDQKLITALTDDELTALIKACQGRSFVDRRDETLVRVIAEVGARAEEVCAMTLGDVDLVRGSAVIRRGKGGKSRMVPLGPKTCQAVDRYLRQRRTHPLADSPALWLGGQGKTFGYAGLYDALKRRAELAGITDFHPHRLRHTFAGRWLASGGSESGLMAVAGWSRRDMIDRYARSTSERRAAEEAARLHLGDI
jgi:site-specific recombinase XerD